MIYKFLYNKAKKQLRCYAYADKYLESKRKACYTTLYEKCKYNKIDSNKEKFINQVIHKFNINDKWEEV